MNSVSAVMLKCEKCEHTWKGRKTKGDARQCPRCRSRNIIEMPPEEAKPATNGSIMLKGQKVPDVLLDDPENQGQAQGARDGKTREADSRGEGISSRPAGVQGLDLHRQGDRHIGQEKVSCPPSAPIRKSAPGAGTILCLR